MPVEKCHQGPCRACSLCKTSNAKNTHPVLIRQKDVKAYQLLKTFKPNIGDTECICMPCAKQLMRNIDNPSFAPRWLPKPHKPPDRCNIENCTHPVHRRTKLATVEELQTILEARVIAFSIEGSHTSIGLRSDHYLMMFRHVHLLTPCESCGVEPDEDLDDIMKFVFGGDDSDTEDIIL